MKKPRVLANKIFIIYSSLLTLIFYSMAWITRMDKKCWNGVLKMVMEWMACLVGWEFFYADSK